jgi:chemotaxis protein MotB
MASIGRRRRHFDIWPGFVDALSSLLMVIIFVLLVFMLAQFYMGHALSGRDQALARLGRQINELSELLSLERKANADLRLNMAQLSAELQSAVAEKERLAGKALQTEDLAAALAAMTARAETASTNAAEMTKELEEAFRTISADREKIELQLRELALLRQDVAALKALRQELEAQVAELGAKVGEKEGQLAQERRLSEEARAHAALLNQQLELVRQELQRIAAALEASEKLTSEQKVEIANLGQRLNQALASKVEELQRYRSEFFGRLRQLLGSKPGIRVEGDRFVFQSELLFPSGSSDLDTGGQFQLVQLSESLKQLIPQIPADVNWVLRIDGHTDRIRIQNARFPSNWELSTARATSVVKFLIQQGIPPERLAAAGFGEYAPLDAGTTPDALAKNRRIEIRLDQR